MNPTRICVAAYAIMLCFAAVTQAGNCSKCDAGGKGKSHGGKIKHHHSKCEMKECIPHPEHPPCASIPYDVYCIPCLNECFTPPKYICKTREVCPPLKCDLPFCRYPPPPVSHKHHRPPYCECGKGGKCGHKPHGKSHACGILARQK